MTAGARDDTTHRTDDGDTVGGPDSDLPEAVIEDLRESGRRRRALEHLENQDTAVPVADLARAVAAAEAASLDAVDDDAVDAVRRNRFQKDLPELTATGVVRYNSLVGTVELDIRDERLFGGPAADEAESGPEDADSA